MKNNNQNPNQLLVDQSILPVNVINQAVSRDHYWAEKTKQLWPTIFSALIFALAFVLFDQPLLINQTTANEKIITVTPTTMIELTNQVRQENNLNQLDSNQQLNLAASNKVKDIFAHQYFSHTGADGSSFSSWFKKAGYDNYAIVGENLAMGYFNQPDIMSAWLASPKHRENIINPLYEDIGLAAATANFHGQQTTIVVQLFGKQITNQSNNNPEITAAIASR
jgi:hypothetical protein